MNTKIISYIWNNIFPSWEDACKFSINFSNGKAFDSKIWLKRIENQLLNYRKEFKKYNIALPPRQSNLALIVKLTNSHKILDFGVSSGWTWEFLKNSIQKNKRRNLKYEILELKEISEYIQKKKLHDDQLRYINFENIKPVDIVYVNAVLQYFKDNNYFLGVIDKSKPNYILLDGLVAKDKHDFFTVQTFDDSLIPFRFIGLQKLIIELKKEGYSPLYSSPCFSPINGEIGPYNMNNFNRKYRLRYAITILLKKDNF